MDRRSPGDRQAVTTTSSSSVVTMATPSSSAQPPSTSLSIIPPDRQAVQVIQHAMHRPQSMAAQYLHQMYAAQQQHFMLQTAALQQHQHPAHLQSLAAIQQASVCQRSPSSSTGSLVQAAGVSQNSITLPASPVTARLIGRTQTSTASAATISQQAMLLGNRPASCNQAQMYLRTQMNLALRTHLPGALATAHSVILKPSTESQALPAATSLSKTPVCGLKSTQVTDGSTETAPSDATPLVSGSQIITPAYPPVQTHTLVKQQLSCPVGQQVAHHQLIVQQATGGAPSSRQLHPIALRVAPRDTHSNPLPLSVKRLTASSTHSQLRNEPQALSSSSSPLVTSVLASSPQTSVPAAAVQPQPPPLVAAPQRRTSFPQSQQPPPPPPPLILPRLPQNPPASLHRVSLHSVRALAVQSGQVLLTERELPVAEALVQMPYQNLPPPQTVAVDLKVHPVKHNETPPLGQKCNVNSLSSEERKDPPSSEQDGTATPPKQDGSAVTGSSSITPSHWRSPPVEESSQLTTTDNSGNSGTNNPPPPPPSPLPPPLLPASAKVPSQPPSAPASLPGSPKRSTHVLTHLVEGFVIKEGLEPFPVSQSSLLSEQQASLPEPQDVPTNGDAADDSPLDADQSDSSDSEMENDGPTGEVAELGESVPDVLQCEYCGSSGYARTFLRSKRFCSMSCVRRFSVSCTKRITVLRAGRLVHRPVGRRGRPPSRVNGASREHFVMQAHRSFGSKETQHSSPREEDEHHEEEEEEEEPPVPMTTRLRKQAERAQERVREQRTIETIIVSDTEEDVGCPSQWNVEQVFSYVSTLPGGADVAEEFRSQEIDGQALLLLTEDHLVSTMNLKLGPALKLCAHINSLKDA
ncbi:polyhomeotic-like protein 3 isoform X3 [Pelmatolapia mariae]|uniref:polyhomeotic-like protein 3 isoform X3 n=1 Tax=Pelmatolapia mariae TaxID=158779 RepID=UPI002FE577AA